MPDFSLEDALSGVVAGVDEAGRGPWAGPVVAGAVVLDRATTPPGLDDSKTLSSARREALFESLHASHRVGIGLATVEEIDRLNILQATLLAMARAVEDLGVRPDMVLVDGTKTPRLHCPARAVVKGDGRSLSIAAASIAAKVTRDRIMAELAREYPGYGWERNVGYGTAEHQRALATLGVTPHHRRTFKPIRNILGEDNLRLLDLA